MTTGARIARVAQRVNSLVEGTRPMEGTPHMNVPRPQIMCAPHPIVWADYEREWLRKGLTREKAAQELKRDCVRSNHRSKGCLHRPHAARQVCTRPLVRRKPGLRTNRTKRRNVFLPRGVELRGHERAEARIFALDLFFQQVREGGPARGGGHIRARDTSRSP